MAVAALSSSSAVAGERAPAGFFGTPLHGAMLRAPNARAALLIVHGICEHSGRFAAAMQWLVQREIACFAFDQRGHGRSPGPRTDIASFSCFVADLRSIASGIAVAHPELPLFLWAHSMGSIVALLALAEAGRHVRGVVSTGCPLSAYARTAPVLLPAARLAAHVAPLYRIASLMGPEQLTHDRDVQRAYVSDPLVTRSATLRLIVELGSASRQARAAAAALRSPWLAVHGGEDRIAPPRGSRELIERLGSSDKRLIVYPGLRHEVHNELEPARTEFLQALRDWVMDRRAGK